jgi:beta-glucosidase
LFGSATAAFQIEGGDNFSDWSDWEKNKKHIIDQSNAKISANSWHKYKKDIDLLKKTKQNAYRLSLSWAKIEPKEGYFDKSAIEYYKKLLLELKKTKIKTMVTLFHFVLPKWAAAQNGFLNKKIIINFVGFCEQMVEELDDLVDQWVTINEPQTYVLFGYLQGKWPPGKKNLFSAFKVLKNLNRAHILSYKKMRKITSTPVGIVENIALFKPLFNNFWDKLFTFIINYLATVSLIGPISKFTDFLGINYYFEVHLQHKKPLFKFLTKLKSDAGWSIYQKGLYNVIMENLIWRKPIYITENGIADEHDRYRPKFIKDAFRYIYKAIGHGADIRGYFHWTLMDNFEWAEGYTQKFGLFTIDRKPRQSAEIYRALIEKYSAD